MEENNEEKVLTKKELKRKAEEIKLKEKERKIEEKREIKEEKERRKNKLSYKIRRFIISLIFVIILVLLGFYFSKEFLIQKQEELSEEKTKQTYQMAEKALNDKEYKKAIELLQTIAETNDEYAKKLKEVEQLYLNEYLVEADQYLKSGKYEKALKVLDSIEQQLKTSEVVIEKKADIRIAQLKTEVGKLAEAKDNIEILKYLSEFDTENIEKISDAIDELKSQYKNSFMLEARELLRTDYAQAKKYIKSAEKYLSEDMDYQRLDNTLIEEFTDALSCLAGQLVTISEGFSEDYYRLLEELKQTTPTTVNLSTIKPDRISGNITISDGNTAINSLEGTEYKNYILKPDYIAGDTEASVEYVLDKKYSKLEGIICIRDFQEGIDLQPAQVTIFDQNNKKIYSTDNVANNNFSIDVTKVEKIKIVFKTNTKEGYFIANPILTQIK